MLPPQIRLNGQLYNLTFTSKADDLGFKTGLGFTVDGSEKDNKLAFIWVCVGSTTLSGWTKRHNLSEDEAVKKIKTVIAATLPYIDIPITVEAIREKYPYKGLTINYFSDERDGYVEKEASYYFKNSFEPEELVKRIVYDDQITQEKIENRTLSLLARYREWDYSNQQPHESTEKGEIFYPDLLELSLIPQAKLELALDVMSQEQLITIRSVDQGIVGVKILAAGIRKVNIYTEEEKAMNKSTRTIFYSWQNSVKPNRNYIQAALEEAIKDQPDFSIDYATRDVKGSPDIAETILEKIKNCDIFLADVSIINPDSEDKKTSNPNVMYELGYAAAIKGYENIILVASRETTDTKELPFDIRNKTIVLSKFDKDSKQRFVEMLQNELAIHSTSTANDEGLSSPYIFIDGSQIQRSESTKSFNINVHNDESVSYHLDSVELDGSEYVVGRSLEPKVTTRNVHIHDIPVPPYDNRVEVIILNVSRGSKKFKIRQKINVTDMATGQFDIAGWEQKPDLILSNS